MKIRPRDLLLAGAAIVATVSAARAADPVPCDPSRTGPIIDVHFHVFATGMPLIAGRADPATRVMEPARDETAHRESSIAEMRRCGIVRAYASGADYQVALRSHRRDPEMLPMAYGVAVPTREDLRLIHEGHARGELAMIGEVTNQYQSVRPDDPRMEPLWALAEELDIPVGLHIGPGGVGVAYDRAPGYRAADSNAYLAEPVLLRHPRLRIFIMHAGWPNGDAMVGMLYSHPQLYVDISALNWVLPRAEFHAYLRRLIDAGYGHRIMFGIDHMAWISEISNAIDAVQSADFLTAEQKRDIFYNNAAAFFRLNGASPRR